MKKGKRLAAASRATLARELLSLADILEERRICANAGPLKAAGNQCARAGGDHWGYDITNLIIPLKANLRCFPTGLGGLTCRLTLSVAGRCSDLNSGRDPIASLESSLSLAGTGAMSPHEFLQSWHFDRHIGSDESAQIHPRYHFQLGGGRMEEHAAKCGFPFFTGVLLLDPPRVAHPPLDGVLAVDFILSNFVGAHWMALGDDVGYKRIVQAAQARYWHPYVSALSTCWKSGSAKTAWAAEDIWPQLR